MYSWLLSVYFYFPLVVSCLKFWCCFAEEGIIKVPYKLFPINSFQGQGRKRGEKRKTGVKKVFMPFAVVCAIYPPTCMELSLKHWLTLLQSWPVCPGKGMAVGCSVSVVQLQQISGYCEDFQLSEHLPHSGVCSDVCWDCPKWMQWVKPLPASGAESPWAAFSSIRKYFKINFTPSTSCCLNQALVFPWWILLGNLLIAGISV